MVKLQFPPSEKEDRTPILKARNVPHLLPITIREHRRPTENERVMSIFSFLGTCLLFIGFLMVLFSIKSVWDLKIENWRLVKENAALKRTVRDNVSVDKFRQQIQSEDEIMEFERPRKVEDPDISWSVSVQIFWSSPYITPCNMNWLARELAEQIYDRKMEIDEEMKNMEIEEKQVEEVFEVATGGPYQKLPDYSETDNTFVDLEEELLKLEVDEVRKIEMTEAPLITSDLYFGEENEIIGAEKAYDEETKQELLKIADEFGYGLDLDLDVKLDN